MSLVIGLYMLFKINLFIENTHPRGTLIRNNTMKNVYAYVNKIKCHKKVIKYYTDRFKIATYFFVAGPVSAVGSALS